MRKLKTDNGQAEENVVDYRHKNVTRLKHQMRLPELGGFLVEGKTYDYRNFM